MSIIRLRSCKDHVDNKFRNRGLIRTENTLMDLAFSSDYLRDDKQRLLLLQNLKFSSRPDKCWLIKCVRIIGMILGYKNCVMWAEHRSDTICINLDHDWSYLTDPKIVSLVKVLTHEIIHLVLDRIEGDETSLCFDDIKDDFLWK